jgi:hypothetical protein
MLHRLFFNCIIVVLLFVITGSSLFAQRIATVSGNWNSTATWGGQPIPTATDSVVINSGIMVTVNVTDAVCSSLQINQGSVFNSVSKINFSAIGNPVLTVLNDLYMGSYIFNTNVPSCSGSIDMTNPSTLRVGGSVIYLAGQWIAGAGTVESFGANSKLNATTFNKLNISAGTTTMLGSITVETLIINTGATLNPPTPQPIPPFATNPQPLSINILGTLINNGTITPGLWNMTISGAASAQSIGNFTHTGKISMTKTSGTATFTGNIITDSLIINGTGGTLNLGSGLTHTINKTLIRTAGTLNGGSSKLILSGLTPVSGTGGTFTSATGTVEYGAAGNQTLSVLNYNNLILSGSGTKTVGASNIVGDLSIQGTAQASLLAGTTDTIGKLTLGNYGKINGGWGSTTATSATNQNNTYFAASTGKVFVSNDSRPTLTISAINQNKNFGDSISTVGIRNNNFSIIGSFVGTDSVNGASLSFSGTPAGNRPSARAGIYSVVPSNAIFSAGNASNYNITYVPGTLTKNALPVSAPTNIVASGINNGGIIEFTQPTNDGGSDLVNYQYSIDSGTTWINASPAITNSPLIIDTGLNNCTNYTIKIRAVNSGGGGAASTSATLKPTFSTKGGVNWLLGNISGGGGGSGGSSIAYGNGVFVAVGNTNGSTRNHILTSSDGISWTRISLQQQNCNDWQSVTYGKGLFVAVGGGNCSANSSLIMTSLDGINWTFNNSFTNSISYRSTGLTGVTYGNGLFVAVSDGYNSIYDIITSSDGVNWTGSNPTQFSGFNGVGFGNGMFVVLSSSNGLSSVATSTDGVNWTSRNTSTSSSLQCITYGNGKFVALPISGSDVVTSTNGINWTTRNTSNGSGYSAIAYGNKLFVAVGSNGVMTSPDGINWTRQTNVSGSGLSAVAYGEGKFVDLSSSSTNSLYSLIENSTIDAPVIGTPSFSNRLTSVPFTYRASPFATKITSMQYTLNGGTTWISPSPVDTTSPLTISGLTNGQFNQIQLRAVNAVGSSCPSNTLTYQCGATQFVKTVSICTANVPYVWNGHSYYNSVRDTITLTNRNGCDSLDILSLTVGATLFNTQTIDTCNSYTWSANLQTYTSSGVYTYLNGCQSKVLNLNIHRFTNSTTTARACNSYSWNGTTYTSSGVFTRQFTNVVRCDSFAILNLTIDTAVRKVVQVNACQSYSWQGTNYSSSGTYVWNGQTIWGCDSTVTLQLTISTPTASSQTVTANGSYLWNGTTYTLSGTYTWTGANAGGCDSVVVLNLSLNPTYALYVTNQVKVSSKVYQFDVYILRTSATPLEFSTIQYGLGIDTMVINGGSLTYNYVSGSSQLALSQQPTTLNVSATTLQPGGAGTPVYRYFNQTAQTAPGVGNGTMISDVKNGCTVAGTRIGTFRVSNTADFRVLSKSNHVFTTQAASGIRNTVVTGYVRGSNVVITGTNMNYNSEGTCDQNPIFNNCDVGAMVGNIHPQICYGQADGSASITLTGTGSMSNGTYRVDGQSWINFNSNPFIVGSLLPGTHNIEILLGSGINACSLSTSVSIASATVLPQKQILTTCNSYTWNGTVYTRSGTYLYNYVNASGCSYSDTLQLTINQSTHQSDVVSASASYTWHGASYTTSGRYVYSYVNQLGCPSADTLYLTIQNKFVIKLFLEGSYTGGGMMTNTLYNLGLSDDETATDSIWVDLWRLADLSGNIPFYSFKTLLHKNGIAALTLPASMQGNSYYISIRHRNSIETWSSRLVTVGNMITYDFSIASSQAFGDGFNEPMKDLGDGVFALYGGDVNQDGTVDLFDAQITDNGAANLLFGYDESDSNGDGSTDLFDLQLIDNNSSLLLYYSRPY